MRTLKKKLSVGNVSNLLSDRQLKATIGGSGGIGNPGNCAYVIGGLYDDACINEYSDCWFGDNNGIVWGECRTRGGFETRCICVPF